MAPWGLRAHALIALTVLLPSATAEGVSLRRRRKPSLADASPAAPRGRALGLDLACVRLSFAAYYTSVGVCPPLLPERYAQLGAPPSRYGQGVAAYSIAQIIGSLVLGPLSDRIGHRQVLAVAGVGTAASLFAVALVQDSRALVATRALCGLFGGIVAVARGAIGADAAQRDQPGRLAELASAGLLGLTVGPLLVGLLSARSGIRVIFGIAAALNLIAAIAVLLVMRGPPGGPPPRSEPKPVRRPSPHQHTPRALL
jgi:MFS family permease